MTAGVPAINLTGTWKFQQAKVYAVAMIYTKSLLLSLIFVYSQKSPKVITRSFCLREVLLILCLLYRRAPGTSGFFFFFFFLSYIISL